MLNRKQIIIIACILSLCLYITGVFSGLIANSIVEKRVNSELEEIKSLMDTSALDLKNIMLQQFFLTSFEDKDCKLYDISLAHMYEQLDFYWKVLPSRLETYEKESPLTDEYLSIKREYTRLLLRTWLITRINYYECDNPSFFPILYFYSNNCDDCVSQGEVFDTFRSELERVNQTLIVFPIDSAFEDDTVFLMTTYYNITSHPSIVIDDRAIIGRIVDNKELRSYANKITKI